MKTKKISEERKKELTLLEKEFADLSANIMPKIREHLIAAHAELDKATDLAEKYNLPFYSSLSPLSQQYVPKGFLNLFPELESWDMIGDDEDFLDEMRNDIESSMGVMISSSTNYGWERSAVC